MAVEWASVGVAENGTSTAQEGSALDPETHRQITETAARAAGIDETLAGPMAFSAGEADRKHPLGRYHHVPSDVRRRIDWGQRLTDALWEARQAFLGGRPGWAAMQLGWALHYLQDGCVPRASGWQEDVHDEIERAARGMEVLPPDASQVPDMAPPRALYVWAQSYADRAAEQAIRGDVAGAARTVLDGAVALSTAVIRAVFSPARPTHCEEEITNARQARDRALRDPRLRQLFDELSQARSKFWAEVREVAAKVRAEGQRLFEVERQAAARKRIARERARDAREAVLNDRAVVNCAKVSFLIAAAFAAALPVFCGMGLWRALLHASGALSALAVMALSLGAGGGPLSAVLLLQGVADPPRWALRACAEAFFSEQLRRAKEAAERELARATGETNKQLHEARCRAREVWAKLQKRLQRARGHWIECLRACREQAERLALDAKTAFDLVVRCAGVEPQPLDLDELQAVEERQRRCWWVVDLEEIRPPTAAGILARYDCQGPPAIADALDRHLDEYIRKSWRAAVSRKS